MQSEIVGAVAHADTTRRAKNESRRRRETNQPWGAVIEIEEDWAMSRREGQKKEQTEALLKKRVPGMKKTCKSKRCERRRGSELAAAEPDSRTMQSRKARRAALLGNPSRGMRLGNGGEADERMRLQGGRKIKERKDK